jgi:sulfur carrier protein ThiS
VRLEIVNDNHEGTPIASVELQIRPPLSYGVSKRAGGLVIQEDIVEGETLGDVLARLAVRNPEAVQQIRDHAKGEIHPPVVTVVNGTVVHRSEATQRVLLDGDRISWFLMYAGG